jgi:hypothetical protein
MNLRRSWLWNGLPVAVMAVIAFAGEGLLHSEPDWLIFLVAIASGLVVAGFTRPARRAADRPSASRRRP